MDIARGVIERVPLKDFPRYNLSFFVCDRNVAVSLEWP
jgi:hypothetical protein